MKKVYMVELGTESSTGVLDDPTQWKFDNLDEALALYNDIDIRRCWILEYNTSHGVSRHNVVTKQIIACMDFYGDIVEYGRILRFDKYGETDYWMEEED